MKTYDAKTKQECLICGFVILHNKQGRFTSHLLKDHDLDLETYLLTYFYQEEELVCSYELCNNLVGLRRGLPKKYCSRSCASKSKPLECKVCGKKHEASHRLTKTCGSECAKVLRSQSITDWHRTMPLDEKKKHFEKIITKTARTRKKNKTPSWNSGKTGVYTKETIEKIRNATLKQMESQVFQKTKIEKIMESYLISLKLNYKYSFILEKRQYDFILIDHDLLIECDGDYWHANPKFYPNPEEWQLERKEIDKEKNEIAIRNGYKIQRFWEDDILNNFEKVKSIINALLATT